MLESDLNTIKIRAMFVKNNSVYRQGDRSIQMMF